jgi:hypothetical protein
MDRLAGMLTVAFSRCRNLELGRCLSFSYDGIELLLLGLPQLRVLRLLGVSNFKLAESAGDDSSSSSKAVAGKLTSVMQQVRDALSRRSAEQQQQQPYLARLAECQSTLQQQQQQQQNSAAAGQPGSSAAAAAVGQCAGELQLQYLEICEGGEPGGEVPQSALLAARQQASSSRSGRGLPALADVLGAWQGLPQHKRSRALVFVNSGGSMVPLLQ